MKVERTKNAARNIRAGFLLKIYQVLVPFVMRTVLLYTLGVEYLGLGSLFASIIRVLNLAELGVGSAMVYSMYRPIAEDNEEEICALMRLYRTYYRVIGLAVLAIGLLCLPFLPRLIKGDVPADVSIYVLYLLNLGATVLSYWLFAYRNCLLDAHQRVDVSSRIRFAVSVGQTVMQVVSLVIFRNYYVYLILNIIAQVLINILTAYRTMKMYPVYAPRGQLSPDAVSAINRRVRDLFTSKLGGVILNSADTIVVSAFLGLTTLAVYQNYYSIVTAVIGFVAIIFGACTAGIGNSLIVETREKNFGDLKKFALIIAWIAGFCTCALVCLFQPFMEIWTRGTKLMLEFPAVLSFGLYFFIYEINMLLNLFKDAAGIWHEDRFRPLVTALTNLALNLILVNVIGIYGVLYSTVAATLFVGMPWLLHNLFTNLFDRKELPGFIRTLLFYAGVTALACAVSVGLSALVPGSAIVRFFAGAAIVVVVPNAIFLLVYRGRAEFGEVLALADRLAGGRLGPVRKMLGGRK